jgi:hypothetical protein
MFCGNPIGRKTAKERDADKRKNCLGIQGSKKNNPKISVVEKTAS